MYKAPLNQESSALDWEEELLETLNFLRESDSLSAFQVWGAKQEKARVDADLSRLREFGCVRRVVSDAERRLEHPGRWKESIEETG